MSFLRAHMLPRRTHGVMNSDRKSVCVPEFLKKLIGASCIVLVFTALLAVPAEPANALEPVCSKTQSGALAVGNCTDHGTTGENGWPVRPVLDEYWWPTGPSYGSCINEYGQTSVLRQMYSTKLPDRNAPMIIGPSDFTIGCVIFFADRPTLPDLQAKAQLVIPTPEINADFADKFLTGAEISFSMVQSSTLRKTLDVPGYNVWLEATPSSYTWDFGDGTTSTLPTPKHIYNSKFVNRDDPDDHLVTVTFTVVWSGSLHVNQILADGTEDQIQADPLDPITVQATLQRPITEVGAVPTEPNEHV